MTSLEHQSREQPSLLTDGRDILSSSTGDRLNKPDNTTSAHQNNAQQIPDEISSDLIRLRSKKAQITFNKQSSSIVDASFNENVKNRQQQQQPQSIAVGKFFSICLVGSLEYGHFDSVNDVYVKYSIVAGPDWIVSSGTDVGITQIARYRLNDKDARLFIWNQPIIVSYRSYNHHGWPQIVVSVYNFDLFGNDQILGYGCSHLPVSNQTRSNQKQVIKIYSPQSSSYLRQILSWLTGKKPELVDSNLFARGDCRSVLQMVTVGTIELSFSLTTKDVANNGFRS